MIARTGCARIMPYGVAMSPILVPTTAQRCSPTYLQGGRRRLAMHTQDRRAPTCCCRLPPSVVDLFDGLLVALGTAGPNRVAPASGTVALPLPAARAAFYPVNWLVTGTAALGLPGQEQRRCGALFVMLSGGAAFVAGALLHRDCLANGSFVDGEQYIARTLEALVATARDVVVAHHMSSSTDSAPRIGGACVRGGQEFSTIARHRRESLSQRNARRLLNIAQRGDPQGRRHGRGGRCPAVGDGPAYRPR